MRNSNEMNILDRDIPFASSAQHAVATTQAALQNALGNTAGVDLAWIEPLHSSNGWTLARDVLRLLVSLVAHLQPCHILEFGSGLSTRVLAQACVTLQPRCCITSVDHDPEFGGMTTGEIIARAELNRHVRFQLAPLVARDCGGKTLPVYHVKSEQFASQLPADLVVIDGPPVMLGGREGILYQALEFARPGTLVLLDDAKRMEEQTSIARWKDTLGETIDVNVLPGFTKGLAAVIVRRPVTGTDLWSYRIRRATQDLATFLPPSDRFILVGEDWWRNEVAAHRHAISFLERDGQYWGAPDDDSTAIRELDRLRRAGATHIVFGWPYYWWLEYYPAFREYLHAEFPCVLRTDRLIIFDLRRS